MDPNVTPRGLGSGRVNRRMLDYLRSGGGGQTAEGLSTLYNAADPVYDTARGAVKSTAKGTAQAVEAAAPAAKPGLFRRMLPKTRLGKWGLGLGLAGTGLTLGGLALVDKYRRRDFNERAGMAAQDLVRNTAAGVKYLHKNKVPLIQQGQALGLLPNYNTAGYSAMGARPGAMASGYSPMGGMSQQAQQPSMYSQLGY